MRCQREESLRVMPSGSGVGVPPCDTDLRVACDIFEMSGGLPTLRGRAPAEARGTAKKKAAESNPCSPIYRSHPPLWADPMPRQALPRLALPYQALPCHAAPDLALPGRASPCLDLPCLAVEQRRGSSDHVRHRAQAGKDNRHSAANSSRPPSFSGRAGRGLPNLSRHLARPGAYSTKQSADYR